LSQAVPNRDLDRTNALLYALLLAALVFGTGAFFAELNEDAAGPGERRTEEAAENDG
jgi:hypothetical protein